MNIYVAENFYIHVICVLQRVSWKKQWHFYNYIFDELTPKIQMFYSEIHTHFHNSDTALSCVWQNDVRCNILGDLEELFENPETLTLDRDIYR